jgi:SAM-dependent methyltransferase
VVLARWFATTTVERKERSMARKVLNVGGNDREIPLPPIYGGWEHVLLDIDPKVKPDVVCDARQMSKLPAGMYDAVYCSHNLEHYFRHEVPKVLAGFSHVLKDGGFVHIVVPDMEDLMRQVAERRLDIDDAFYHSPLGPVMVLDIIYGYSVEIEKSGNDYFAHKTGFTLKSLLAMLMRCGFRHVYSGAGNSEVVAFAFKLQPDEFSRKLIGIP